MIFNPFTFVKQVFLGYALLCVGLQTWSFYQAGQQVYAKVQEVGQAFEKVSQVQAGLEKLNPFDSR